MICYSTEEGIRLFQYRNVWKKYWQNVGWNPINLLFLILYLYSYLSYKDPTSVIYYYLVFSRIQIPTFKIFKYTDDLKVVFDFKKLFICNYLMVSRANEPMERRENTIKEYIDLQLFTSICVLIRNNTVNIKQFERYYGPYEGMERNWKSLTAKKSNGRYKVNINRLRPYLNNEDTTEATEVQ